MQRAQHVADHDTQAAHYEANMHRTQQKKRVHSEEKQSD